MILVFGRPGAWREGRAKCELKEGYTRAVWIVRWISPHPPTARLDREIVRMPDNHSRAGAFSSFTPLPLLSSPLTSATQTTRLCCKQHTCWLPSPSGPAPSLAQLSQQKCRSVYNLGTQSQSYSNCSIYFTRARRGRKKRSDCSVACC